MKKTIALFLAALMLFALLPVAAFAEGEVAQALDADGKVIKAGTLAECLAEGNVKTVVLLQEAEGTFNLPVGVILDLGGFTFTATDACTLNGPTADKDIVSTGNVKNGTIAAADGYKGALVSAVSGHVVLLDVTLNGAEDAEFVASVDGDAYLHFAGNCVVNGNINAGDQRVAISGGVFTQDITKMKWAADGYKLLPYADGKTFGAVSERDTEAALEATKVLYNTVEQNAKRTETLTAAEGQAEELLAKAETVEGYKLAGTAAKAIVFETIVGFAKEDAIAAVRAAAGDNPSKAVEALVKDAERNIKLASYELITPAALAKEFIEAIENMQFAERQAKQALDFAKEFATDLMGEDGPIQQEQKNTQSFIAKIIDIIVNLFTAIFAPLFGTKA